MAMSFGKAKNIINAFTKAGARGKATSVFKKASFIARTVFNKSRIDNDMLVKGASMLGYGLGKGAGMARNAASLISANKKAFTKKAVINTNRSRWNSVTPRKKSMVRSAANLGSSVATGGLLTVGAVGMLSIGIMNGINNGSKDIVLERYLQDQRFSRDILMQSRVGTSMGTSRMNQMGSTVGLSNALSRTRHGASY